MSSFPLRGDFSWDRTNKLFDILNCLVHKILVIRICSRVSAMMPKSDVPRRKVLLQLKMGNLKS